MGPVLWVMLCALSAAAADEAADPEGLLDVASKESQYSMYVGRWTECVALGVGEHAARTIDRFQRSEPESLVHTPILGLQRRQIQCRNKDGQFVETMYCNSNISRIPGIRVCVVREDCALGEWLPWRPRPDGSLVRTRTLNKLPQGGGRECEVVEEVRPAALEASAHWSPAAWGPCTVAPDANNAPLPASDDDDDADDGDEDSLYADEAADEQEAVRESRCGGGVQRRDAACVRADGRALHAAHCAHQPLPALVQPCEVPCPRDCAVGEWSEWGACQPTDGCPLFPVQQLTTTGYSVRRRRVVSAASGGGAPCPPLEEKRACPSPRCAAWQALPWGPCVLTRPHAACGPGTRTRELRCVGHDGKEAQRAWCSGGASPARVERCRIACPGDCVVSAWGAWAPCSAPCAPHARPRPHTHRARHVLAHAAPDGWPCPPAEQLVQNETCNTHACATYSWLATPWGPCQRTSRDYIPANNYTDFEEGEELALDDDEEPCVEEGEMTRDVMCVQDNADVVREALCAPLKRPASRRACTVRCHRGCKVEAWMPWTPCPNTCEPGKQTRVRTVHGGPGCGPRQETRDCPVPASCRASATAWATGPWTTCRLPPHHRCGDGYRVRSIWCGSASQRVEAGACAGQVVPPAVAPCTVPCHEQITTITCEHVCNNILKYLDSTDPDVPNCVCPQISLELLPSDSDCILPPGVECGEGRVLRAARCTLNGQDMPMDICKKYHPLTGPYRVRVPETDGYSYDEEFPGLLRGPCSVRCARDCAAGPWAPWGPCAPEPGSRAAFRFRTREVLESGGGGGRECGATLQRATCAVSAPRWVTGAWQPCAPRRARCGHAIINRTVTCVGDDGKRLSEGMCEASVGPAPVSESPCRAPCPADCVVSEWSEWSPCEQTKWGGRRDRTRVVLRAAAEGGAPCPQLVAAEPCAPLYYSWHVAPWDDCQPLGGSPCGEGVKRRAVRCLRSDGVFVNNSYCPNSTASEASESWCYVPCGVDCEVGPWGAWDTSACRCGDTAHTRHMRRTRQQLVSAVWPGRSCPAVEQRAPCPRTPCVRLVARPDLFCQTYTSEVSGACGWGVKVSHAWCEVSSADDPSVTLAPWRCTTPLPGRIVVPPLPHQEEEACSVGCGCSSVGGRAGAWGAWGPCRGGARARTRHLAAPPTPPCDAPARLLTIEWANCSGAPDEIPELLAFEPRDDKPRRPSNDRDLYQHRDIENSTSGVVVMWTAIVVIVVYAAYWSYRGVLRCVRSRRLKTITKV